MILFGNGILPCVTCVCHLCSCVYFYYLSLSSLQKVSSLQSQLLSCAQQLHQELETYYVQLSEVTHSLEQARKRKKCVADERIYARHEAASAHAKEKVLLVRRMDMGWQLELKKRELCFLQQLQGQLREGEEGKREREELRKVLMHKDVEVRQLQEQFREVEKELGCVGKKAHSLREDFQRMTVELLEKSAKVQELERTRDKLEGYLDGKRRRIDMLLIQSTTSSKEALLKEIKV